MQQGAPIKASLKCLTLDWKGVELLNWSASFKSRQLDKLNSEAKLFLKQSNDELKWKPISLFVGKFLSVGWHIQIRIVEVKPS